MGSLADALYRVGRTLTSPREAFYIHLAEKHSLSLPLIIYISLSFSLSSLTVKSVFAMTGLSGIIPELVSDFLIEFFGIIGLTFSISLLILYATVIHLTARIAGYTLGKWEEVLCAVAYSVLPQSFTAFALALSYLFSSYEFLLTSVVLMALAGLWSLYIIIEEISVIYDTSIGHSVLISVVGPILILLTAIGLLSVIGLSSLAIEIAVLVALYYWRVGS